MTIATSSTRGSPDGFTPAEHGFTLIELLVVIAIMALLAAVAATRLSRGAGAQSANQNAGRTFALLESAHHRALSTGQTVVVRATDLPAGFVIGGNEAEAATLAFYPDGSATGGVVRGPRGREIAIDWISGHAHARN